MTFRIALLTLFIFSCLVGKSQDSLKVTIVKDSIISTPTKSWPNTPTQMKVFNLSNGSYVYPGLNLKLGKGTLPNGDFNYIATPSNSMEAKLKRDTKLKEIRVKELKKKGNEKYGFRYIIIAEGNYLIQLENAIAAGEIILR